MRSYNGVEAFSDLRNSDRDWSVAWKDGRLIFPQGLNKNADLQACFQYLMEQWFERVEPPVSGVYSQDGNWGANFRKNRNANNYSCHASATALDFIATRHPNGSSGTYTDTQYKAIAEILDELDGVVTVGIPGLKTSSGRLVGWTLSSGSDEMHKEATANEPEHWAKVAAKIRPLLGKGAQGKPATRPKHESETGSVTVKGVSAEQVQKLLNKAGADPKLAVDNVYGELTTQAVREFQVKHGLRVDGIVGPKTWSALEGAVAPHKVPPFPLKHGQVFGTWNCPGWAKLTRSGDPRWDGADIRNLVRTIQRRLQATGFAPKPAGWADGVFEPPTARAVRKFQRSQGLAADGLVGKNTWARLFA